LLALGTWGVAQTHDSVNVVGTPQVRAQNNTAVISWQTDKVAATQVKYGTDPNNMSQKANEAGGSKNHNVTLSNLEQGKTYYFAILDNDGQVRQQGQFVAGQSGTQSAGNMGSTGSSSGSNSGSSNASNNGAMDNVVIVAGPVVQNLTANSASLWWQTDDRAATHVKYGTDANNPQQSAYERGGDRNHTVQLTNLQPGQTYYYQVLRQNGSVRTTGQFSTPGANAGTTTGQSGQTAAVQITSGPTLETVGDKYAIVTWTTAQPSSSDARIGTDPNNLPLTASGQWGTNHRVQLGGLQPNTHYYFVIGSSQQQGQQQATNTGQFTTISAGQSAVNTGTWRR
jgi:hypothetical protein